MLQKYQKWKINILLLLIRNKRRNKIISNKSRNKSRARYNSKTLNTGFKSFFGQSYFDNDGENTTSLQNFTKTFPGLIDTVSERKSKRSLNEKFTSLYIANVSVSLELVWMNNSRIKLKLKGSC